MTGFGCSNEPMPHPSIEPRKLRFGAINCEGQLPPQQARLQQLLGSDVTPDRSRTGARASKLGVASAGCAKGKASNETAPHIHAHPKPTPNQRIKSGERRVVEQLVTLAGSPPGSSILSRTIKDRLSDVPRRLVLLHTALSPVRRVIHRSHPDHVFAAIVAAAVAEMSAPSKKATRSCKRARRKDLIRP